MRTSELTGAALDWAVAVCEGVNFVWLETDYSTDGRTFQRGTAQAAGPHYSTNWAQGGPIIEREAITVSQGSPVKDLEWMACDRGSTHVQHGPTYLIAAMRCYVASKLGDTVDVPEGFE